MGRSFMMQRLTHLVSTPGRILVAAVVSLLVILLAFTGIGQTLAVWNSQATAAGSATAAQLDLTTDFGNAAADFANHRTAVTGSFTLTNQTVTTSTAEASYNATIAAPGDAALRNALTVTIWPQNGEGCTATATPANVVASGTWAQSPFTVSGSLATSETDTFCMRMQAGERGQLAAPGGTLSINPSITASLTIGTWTDSASGAVVQKTAYVFPAANPTERAWYQLVNVGNGTCASVTTAGALSAATCSATADIQHVKFAASGDGYQEIIPRSSSTRRLDVAGASTAVGAVINTQPGDASRLSQDWQMQFKGNNGAGSAIYQIVNRLSGYCMQAASPAYTQRVCDGTTTQAFTLTIRGVDVILSLNCSSSLGTVTYVLSEPAVGQYVFAFQSGTSGTYAPVAPVGAGSTSATYSPAQIGSLLTSGVNGLQVTWLGYVIGTSTVWKDGTANSAPLACKAPTLETLSCVQSPPNSVVVNWGHQVPSGTSYRIGLLAGTGGAGETQLATVTSGTSYTLTPDNWADGTRTIRVTSLAGTIVEITVAKSGGTANNATERLWCLTDVSSSVTVTCNPTGTATRVANVTVSWPTGPTRGNQVMLEIAGNDDELFLTVATNAGISSITVPAASLPRNQVVAVKMTRIGDTGTGGFVLGTKTFDSTRSSGSDRSRCS